MRRLWSNLLVASILAMAGGQAWAQITTINMAINKAGYQRALSQRVAKLYIQIGVQINAERGKKLLDESVAQLDRELVELKNFAPTPEIKNHYLKQEALLSAYKDVVLGNVPSPDNGRKVLAISEDYLALANQGTGMLEKQAGTTAGHLVNISGRQRALSQRMAKFYNAEAWGVSNVNGAAILAATRKEFAAALNELGSSPANTSQINESLELVRQQWVFFDSALNRKPSITDKEQLSAIATTSERILEELNRAVGLYEKLPSK
ncbi:MAG: type IV pili methyl-accepting chemotaxis transducer N-terminal domain-containing protein [Desulfovibrionaceae bacterium]|nr:type IV pili methyl-accepting chemotaxis transducer N-terminal domain-containing protein [Desulfovibrionaceae bacterium]